MLIYYFAIIFPWKGPDTSLKLTWISFTLGQCVSGLFENDPVDTEKNICKLFMHFHYIAFISL